MVGKKEGGQGFSVIGAVKKLGGAILSGAAKVVSAVGKVAQMVLDAANTFPFLKPILKVPVPIPGIGAIQVGTLLKGVATTGRITERLANAYRVYAQGGSLDKVLAELPVGDIVEFILAPILSAFSGVFAILRVGKPAPPEVLNKMVALIEGMIKRVPKSLRKTVIEQMEKKLGFNLPGAVINIIEKVE